MNFRFSKQIALFSITILVFYVLFASNATLQLDNVTSEATCETRRYFNLKSECSCRRNETIQLFLNSKNGRLDFVNVSMTKNLTSENLVQNLNFTCQIYSELRRGPGQRVLGFSLYGKHKSYYKKLRNITLAVKKMYPDWLIRVYHDSSIDTSIICEIECQRDYETNALLDNTDFCDVEELNLNIGNLMTNRTFDLRYVHAMMWRWFPLFDSYVDVFASRDSDSYVLQREVDSVKVWLESNNLGHIMRGRLLILLIAKY
jgi:hypothetical protein